MAPIIKREKPSYSENNSGGSKGLFDKKTKYDIEDALSIAPNIVDFNFGEYIYYGRMNLRGMPIVLASTDNLKKLRKSADNTAPLSALNFVGLIFDQMAQQFDKSSATQNIAADQKYLSNLKVYRAYESPWRKYQEYKDIYFQQLSQKFLEIPDEQKFKDMKQFLNYLTRYLAGPASVMPFTYPSFIKSRLSDIMGSGLAIEIADIKYSNDQEKVEHFLDSPNWDYYVNACNQYGFIIDKQYPFRLVADINSTAMKGAARALVNGGGYNLLHRAFVPAISAYLPSLVSDLITLYNLSTTKYYTETVVCANGTPRTQYKKTPQYSPNSFFKGVSINDVLVFYMTTRINEQKPNMNPQDRQSLIKDCLDFYNKSKDLSTPLMVFEAIVSSTVDKIGSFAYYIKQAKEFMAVQERPIVPQNIDIQGDSFTGEGGY